jgi:hypothetical protein
MVITKTGGERGRRRRKASKRWGKETGLFETQIHPQRRACTASPKREALVGPN